MGDIDESYARDVYSLLGHVRRKPLTLKIEGLDIFGGDKPRALVARIAPTPALVELQAEQERLVRRVGLAARQAQVHAPRHSWRACGTPRPGTWRIS